MKNYFSHRSLTLIELLIAIVLFSAISLGFYSIDIFSRNHVLISRRRAQLQNELSRVFLHMSKYVQNASGYIGNPPLSYNSMAGGFVARVDCKVNPTFNDYNDDSLIYYHLQDKRLIVECRNAKNPHEYCMPDPATSLTCIPLTETLAIHMLPGTVVGQLPPNPNNGFYFQISDNGCRIEVGLVARWNPDLPSSPINPQVSARSTFYAGSASCR